MRELDHLVQTIFSIFYPDPPFTNWDTFPPVYAKATVQVLPHFLVFPYGVTPSAGVMLFSFPACSPCPFFYSECRTPFLPLSLCVSLFLPMRHPYGLVSRFNLFSFFSPVRTLISGSTRLVATPFSRCLLLVLGDCHFRSRKIRSYQKITFSPDFSLPSPHHPGLQIFSPRESPMYWDLALFFHVIKLLMSVPRVLAMKVETNSPQAFSKFFDQSGDGAFVSMRSLPCFFPFPGSKPRPCSTDLIFCVFFVWSLLAARVFLCTAILCLFFPCLLRFPPFVFFCTSQTSTFCPLLPECSSVSPICRHPFFTDRRFP